MSFCRTFGSAIATSLTNTVWEDKTNYNRSELAGLADQMHHYSDVLINAGWSAGQVPQQISDMVESQAVMLATSQLLTAVAYCFVNAAIAVWIAPMPTRVADTSAAH
ncbi:hypothetical protein CU664_23380 [Pseudomonas syringae pv. actinidifoliorum]|uniref:hypothetical protein n=1 Tax=Pseudomonas syringae TaxID=317 RepID=UPI001373037A|nr:hypothetical protein [Pseudomonas syringae]NAS97687.1 hypothetical protein [Pseudomonas syringae pv. actinidifoliorum]NAT66003.1 hypothetical protein [Pseudomonas syringae pv. actinidifoliorum]